MVRADRRGMGEAAKQFRRVNAICISGAALTRDNIAAVIPQGGCA